MNLVWMLPVWNLKAKAKPNPSLTIKQKKEKCSTAGLNSSNYKPGPHPYPSPPGEGHVSAIIKPEQPYPCDANHPYCFLLPLLCYHRPAATAIPNCLTRLKIRLWQITIKHLYFTLKN